MINYCKNIQLFDFRSHKLFDITAPPSEQRRRPASRISHANHVRCRLVGNDDVIFRCDDSALWRWRLLLFGRLRTGHRNPRWLTRLDSITAVPTILRMARSNHDVSFRIKSSSQRYYAVFCGRHSCATLRRLSFTILVVAALQTRRSRLFRFRLPRKKRQWWRHDVIDNR